MKTSLKLYVKTEDTQTHCVYKLTKLPASFLLLYIRSDPSKWFSKTPYIFALFWFGFELLRNPAYYVVV